MQVNEYLTSQGGETHGVGVIQSNPDQSKHLETATMKVRSCLSLRPTARLIDWAAPLGSRSHFHRLPYYARSGMTPRRHPPPRSTACGLTS